VPDILKIAQSLLDRAKATSALPVSERTAERLVMFTELQDVMLAVLQYHKGYVTANRDITDKALRLGSLFFENKRGVWSLRPDTSRHYRSELESLLRATNGMEPDA